MERRDFVKLCADASAGATLPAPADAATLKARLYKRARLVDARGEPFKAESLKVGVKTHRSLIHKELQNVSANL